MTLEIVHYNDPVLRKKGERVTAFGPELAALTVQMVNALHAAHGIGLAAQQVGRAVQVCIIDLRETQAEFDWKLDGAHPPLELFMPMVMVNPKVTVAKHTPRHVAEEGCLSFPAIHGDVERPVAVTAKFQDADGLPHVLECDGLFARCVQHEVDHLNGILYIDRMAGAVRASIEEEVKALARATRAARAAAAS